MLNQSGWTAWNGLVHASSISTDLYLVAYRDLHGSSIRINIEQAQRLDNPEIIQP